MSISERKVRIAILGILACSFFVFIIGGCSSSQKPVPRGETKIAPSPAQPETQQSPAEPVAMCPERNDVRRSIVEGEKILAGFDLLIKNNNAPVEAINQTEMRTQILDWQKTNKSLIDGCDLLLGADGTSVFPEIPLALENLNLAERWLSSALDCIESNDLSASRLYIRAADAAIKQSDKVLEKKMKSRRSAMLKIPGYLKAAERKREKSGR